MSDSVMKVSEAGLALIRKFEGLRLSDYICPGGIRTIGYGHTGADVKQGMKISVDQANELLLGDVAKFERSVNELVTVAMTQGMFDALVSFTFNLGAGSLKRSDLLRRLNSGDMIGAGDEFLKWNKAGGKVLTGLTERRKAENRVFMM